MGAEVLLRLTGASPFGSALRTGSWSRPRRSRNVVEDARSVLDSEDLLFARDRVALERVAERLLDLQRGRSFDCHTDIGRQRKLDHFVPWSYSGDDS
jgi:hypothetical protein